MGEKDYLISRGILKGYSMDGYDYLYYKTNENLVDMYKQVDFKGKDVLSVLASSDQVFTARLLGAKTVDSFDSNALSLYYYYLRVWSLKYMNTLYPNVFYYKWMYYLLKQVVPQTKEEASAKKFFLLHLKNHTDFEEMFFEIDMQPEGKTLFENPWDLKNCYDQPMNFYHYNLFSNKPINKKYDIIMISNILDWSHNKEDLLTLAENNLRNMLKTNGKILCCCLSRYEQDKEKELFQNYEYSLYGAADYSYTRTREL